MKKPKVTCKWLEVSKCLVNPDGQVLPCCYLANTSIHHTYLDNKELDLHDTYGSSWKTNKVLKKYIENKKDYNLDNRPINDILRDDWFNKDLPESWEDYETIPFACKIFCDANYSTGEDDGQ